MIVKIFMIHALLCLSSFSSCSPFLHSRSRPRPCADPASSTPCDRGSVPSGKFAGLRYRAQVKFSLWRQIHKSIFLKLRWANQAYSKENRIKNGSVTKDMNFWKRYPKTLFASEFSKFFWKRLKIASFGLGFTEWEGLALSTYIIRVVSKNYPWQLLLITTFTNSLFRQ